ncbi:hypothetical protein CesoFtcFv8_006687 [Champsocephalus esox]|uniref:Uncharacterized protein n=1 Tax=Champsocephalus esox TaxID=159716 RepID=A0AAN8CJV1_9TELE|nr:hypothetical protein CesoFtcFv8_006687 [Champsocephalus esox]
MRSGTTPDFSGAGRAYGCCPVMEGGHHGRRSERLIGYLRRSPGERSLEQRPPAGTRKLPGAFSGVPHLKRFLPSLRGHHVPVRTDNTISCMNRQGRLRCLQSPLAHKLIPWSGRRLLSLRTTRVPGVMHLGTELLSKGAPLYADWTPHPRIGSPLWVRYGGAALSLFAKGENAQ